jgi:hypothetical protein
VLCLSRSLSLSFVNIRWACFVEYWRFGFLILSSRNAFVDEVDPAKQHSSRGESEDGANAPEPPCNEESDSSDEGEVDYDPPEEFEDVRDKFMDAPRSHCMRSVIVCVAIWFFPLCFVLCFVYTHIHTRETENDIHTYGHILFVFTPKVFWRNF